MSASARSNSPSYVSVADSDIAASRDAGFAHHLTKPVDLEALSAAIAQVAHPAGSTSADANPPQ